jgi:predicted dehydrogenase
MSENSKNGDTDDQGRLTRRDFLKRTGAGAAAISAFPTIIPQNVKGANDQINVAVVGIRGRGGGHISQFADMDNVRVQTICDIDENLFPERVAEVREEHGYEPNTEYDMREVFDDPEIDAVGFATPNHWHALGAIWAAQAGKHVYVEKPASHRFWEGRQMVRAARANDVIMQVGFQNRSRQNTRAAIKFLREGGIGDIYMARGLCYKPRWNIGRYPDGPMASDAEPWTATTRGDGGTLFDQEYLSNVHYDLWRGPAPERPFNPNRFHYNWHWQWDYGNGDTGNQGPHQIDIGRWGLGKEEYPETIRSSGDLFMFEESQQNTPNTQTTIFEYADGTIFEFGTRGLFTPADGDIKIGNVFYGTEGWMEIDAGGNWQTYLGYDGEPGPNSDNISESEYDPSDLTGGGGGGHFSNFIAAVRSGNREDLTCDIEVGHRSTALAHLGNIAYRLERELEFDGDDERFVDDDEADAMLSRDEYRDPYVVPNLA